METFVSHVLTGYPAFVMDLQDGYSAELREMWGALDAPEMIAAGATYRNEAGIDGKFSYLVSASVSR